MRRLRRQLPRFAFRLFELAVGLLLLAAVAHHVLRSDFKPLLTLGVPMLAVFYGFASVLFVRGRAMSKGPWQNRSLYAAERAMQATVWYLLSIALAVTVYVFLKHFTPALDPSASPLARAGLALFLLPLALMQTALMYFMRGMSVLAPDFFRATGTFKVARRVRQVP